MKFENREQQMIPFGELLAEPLKNGLTKPKAIRGTGVKMIAMGEIFSCSRIGNIEMDRVPVTEKEETNYSIQKGDLLFARQSLVLEGAGKCSIVTTVPETTVFESHLIRARIDPQKANPYYYYYYFNSYLGRENIKTIVEQVSAAGIRGSDLIRLKVPFPPLAIQNRIVECLNFIDQKIELNNKINDNLEQQVQAIYAKVFLSDKRRTKATIKDVALNVTDGVHNTVQDDPSGNYFLLSCKNIKGGHLTIGNSERIISKETFEKLRKRTKLEKGDILLSSVGTVGELMLLKTQPNNFEFQRSVAMIKPNPQVVSPVFLYEALLAQKETIVHAAHGAVQQCIFISDICDFIVPLPTREELEWFDNIVDPMFAKTQQITEENERLVSIRDALLPKLMAGEIL